MRIVAPTVACALLLTLANCDGKEKGNDNRNGGNKNGRKDGPLLNPTTAPTEAPETLSGRITVGGGTGGNSGGGTAGGGTGGSGGSEPTPRPTNAPTPRPTAAPTPGAGVNGTCEGETTTDMGISWHECLLVVDFRDAAIRQRCTELEGIFTDNGRCPSENLLGTCAAAQTPNGLFRNIYKTGNAEIDAELYRQIKSTCTAPYVWRDPQ